ncbi:hypothetical protein KALB_5450 [Kutzneria albida DSM 43870]|uniref:UspA domain-containing protein n=1 Tax=Kutzneria albida DSM 43870 TaxID=1449976 RepID=W5WD66_9PSEU|nr:hypothetical protein KALB_5450 [Kutzneria albida DSM 43870]
MELDLHTCRADPATVLLGESDTACLVVVGARGRGGFPGLLLGSTALAVATGGHCPAVVVREQPVDSGPVAVGVTGSPLSDIAVGHAFDQASARAEPLIAVHAWHPLGGDVEFAAAMGRDWAQLQDEQDQLLTGWLADWQRGYPGVRVTRMIATRRATRQLLDYDRIAQLIVVGCRGRSRISGLVLGSVPRVLLHQARCPLLVVRTGHEVSLPARPHGDR